MECFHCSRVSVVGIASVYGLNGRGIEPRLGQIFRTRPDRPTAHRASYAMLTGLFPRAERPALGVNHPPQSSAKADERVELNLYSPALPSL